MSRGLKIRRYAWRESFYFGDFGEDKIVKSLSRMSHGTGAPNTHTSSVSQIRQSPINILFSRPIVYGKNNIEYRVGGETELLLVIINICPLMSWLKVVRNTFENDCSATRWYRLTRKSNTMATKSKNRDQFFQELLTLDQKIEYTIYLVT